MDDLPPELLKTLAILYKDSATGWHKSMDYCEIVVNQLNNTVVQQGKTIEVYQQREEQYKKRESVLAAEISQLNTTISQLRAPKAVEVEDNIKVFEIDEVVEVEESQPE